MYEPSSLYGGTVLWVGRVGSVSCCNTYRGRVFVFQPHGFRHLRPVRLANVVPRYWRPLPYLHEEVKVLHHVWAARLGPRVDGRGGLRWLTRGRHGRW
jgi:hypothetical protein